MCAEDEWHYMVKEKQKNMGDALPYNDYGSYLRGRFGMKVQKIPVDGGFSCPNRDGTKGRGGCSYCDGRAFVPAYIGRRQSIKQQLESGKQFFQIKNGNSRVKYLAYFQSYSNTYAPLPRLQECYDEALSTEGIEGLVISTRPDCIEPEVLEYLSLLSQQTFVLVEIGIESLCDKTLQNINRRHAVADAFDCAHRLNGMGIPVGGHLVLGLPGEDTQMWLEQAEQISQWPLTTLKLHQLQIIHGTRMAAEYKQRPQDFNLFDVDAYVDLLANYIARLRSSLVIERFVSQVPSKYVVAPYWGLKPDVIQQRLVDRMRELNLIQGALNGK